MSNYRPVYNLSYMSKTKPLNVLLKLALLIIFQEIICLMPTSPVCYTAKPTPLETALLYIHDHLINVIGSQQTSLFRVFLIFLLPLTLLTMIFFPLVYLLGLVSTVLLSAGFVIIFRVDLLLSNVLAGLLSSPSSVSHDIPRGSVYLGLCTSLCIRYSCQYLNFIPFVG